MTSTPQSESDGSIHAAFDLPLSKIEVTDGTQRNTRTSDVCDFTSSIEMCELEMTCETEASQVNSVFPKNKSNKKTEHPKHADKSESSNNVYLLRLTERRKKNQCVFVRLLKDAKYMIYKVLKYLSGHDLLRLSHVNQELRQIIIHDKNLNTKRMTFISTRRKQCDQVGKVSNIIR